MTVTKMGCDGECAKCNNEHCNCYQGQPPSKATDHFYLFQGTDGNWHLVLNDDVFIDGASEIKVRLRNGEPARLIVEYHILRGQALGEAVVKEHGRGSVD